MTNERTPLAILVSALTDLPLFKAEGQGGRKGNQGPENHDEWWQQKKRKRAVACGRCDACNREDCGVCLNCLDKPKFGGNGIRKQSCVARKCHSALPASCSTSKASTFAASSQEPASHTHDWDAFWGAVECCMALQAGSSSVQQSSPSPPEDKSKRLRAARCGTCIGCVRGDCGECKNCLDKPKFGGRGIKKQACTRRACSNPQDESDSETTQSTAGTGFVSAEPSPEMLPIEGGEVAAFELDPVQRSKPENGKMARIEGRTSAMGYCTGDEEQTDSPVPTKECPIERERLLIAQALMMACERC